MIEVEFAPHRAALLKGEQNTLNVLFRIKSREQMKASERLPLNLSLVIDRSGSMSGRPLHEAKRCASMMVDRLSPSDRLSLVVFDTNVDVLVSSRPVGDRAAFKKALGRFTTGGSTALHAGWLAGAEQVATHHSGRELSRVLLISDGCANVGLTGTDAIAQHCQQMAEAGVATSTYGLGSDFNEELMTAMARQGLGSAYYGQSAEDLMDPFQEEFDLLSSLCARRLRLKLEPVAGVTVEVLNDYPVDTAGRQVLPDLAYDSEAWAMIKISIPHSMLETRTQSLKVLEADLSYEDIDGERHTTSARLVLPVLPSDAFEAVAKDETVTARTAELAAAAIQIEARRAAQAGDWARVRQHLEALRVAATDNPWLEASVRELERYADQRRTQDFSKEALYKAGRMRSRLAALDELSAEWSSEQEASRASFHRRKLEQGRRFENPSDGADSQPD